MDPEDVPALIPETCIYVTLSGKRHFTDIIKLSILRQEDHPGLFGGHNVITRDLIREECGPKSQDEIR